MDMQEETPEPESSPSDAAHLLARVWRALRWPVRVVALAFVLGLLGIGWTLLRAPAPPAPSVKGTQPVPSAPLPESSSSPAQPSARLCALLTHLLGATVAPLVGCATVPSRPDPIVYLASCSPEARATPVKLGFAPQENPSFLETGTPASDDSIEEGGSINVKPGPVTATMLAEVKGQEMRVMISGQATTLPHRLYMQFDQLLLPDGSSLPICGVAVDDLHEYGIPTYAKLPMRGARVDPAKVDKSPGSVVLNDPRFETVLQGPEGYPLPRVGWAPPDWR
jgi:eukaryotic-like serine/threonine-protein kinase